jgi:phage tail-like protein
LSEEVRAMGRREDINQNFRYLVEIDGITEAGFSEVIMPESSTVVIEYRDGNMKPSPIKLPGLTRYTNLVLRKGVNESLELYDWRGQVEAGNIDEARRDLSVILLDSEGNEVARWNFTGAWPSKYYASPLLAEREAVALETFEIAFEKMERIK